MSVVIVLQHFFMFCDYHNPLKLSLLIELAQLLMIGKLQLVNFVSLCKFSLQIKHCTFELLLVIQKIINDLFVTSIFLLNAKSTHMYSEISLQSLLISAIRVAWIFSERLPVFISEIVDYSFRSTNESTVESGDLMDSRDLRGVLSLLILVQLIIVML